MKTLMILALTLLSFSAQAETVRATDDDSVPVTLLQGSLTIPQTGAVAGWVHSVYGGSAYGVSRYMVVVSNTEAPCEDDACISALKTFELSGMFIDAAKAVYSRKIDANTYSIAIFTTQVQGWEDGEDAKYVPVKILLRVKFTAEGVADVADMKVVNR